MKKVLLILGLSVAILLLAGYFVAAYFLGGVVKSGVNNLGPRLTQSPVTLDGATISPFSGTGTLTGLTVGNPAGWSPGPAMQVGKMHLQLEPRSAFGDVIVIDELTIDEPAFNYETKLVSSNIQDLLKNIQAYAGGGQADPAKEGPPKKFIVKKLRFTNGKATVIAAGASLPVPLPEIALDNLGVAEGGITANQLALIVMRDVVSKIAAAAATALPQLGLGAGGAGLQKTEEAVKQVGDALKKMLDRK